VDFALTEEQEMLRDQAREYLTRYDVDKIAELADSDEGWDPSSWGDFEQLGWLGVSVAEERGGAGLSFIEEAVIVEELGRALYPGPYLTTIVALPALDEKRVADVVAGNSRWSVAFEDNGLVPDAGVVDNVLVVDDDALWAVTGFDVEALPTMDSTRRFGRISGGRREQLNGDAEQVRLRALGLAALEAVGVAQRALELGIEHASTREQFGKKIGIYQAVSHPLADTFVETELSRSLAYWAAWSIAEGDEQAPVAAAAAKSHATETAVAAVERSIQVHGGIGFTWEHVLHRYYKRAQWLQAWDGFPAVQRARVADALLGDTVVRA
jgi:alkylation response protein AidB-like acyl-CoA dehydrogenase